MFDIDTKVNGGSHSELVYTGDGIDTAQSFINTDGESPSGYVFKYKVIDTPLEEPFNHTVTISGTVEGTKKFCIIITHDDFTKP